MPVGKPKAGRWPSERETALIPSHTSLHHFALFLLFFFSLCKDVIMVGFMLTLLAYMTPPNASNRPLFTFPTRTTLVS